MFPSNTVPDFVFSSFICIFMDMKGKLKYEAPTVLEQVVLEIENEILAASVVVDEDVTVETCGQEVVEIDASSFTSNWE